MINNYLTKITVSLFILAVMHVGAQNYTVSPIPHQAYSNGAAVEFTFDDYYSPVISLPFQFTFFGNNFNQLVASTNGTISFDISLANQTSPWNFSQTIPNPAFPMKNAILGCFHDLDNSSATGTVTYTVIGAAPFRRFVVMFDNNPHFQCSSVKSSFQMVLYETLNIIDSQIIEKQICPGWNSGRAVIGIINTDGSNAYAPPGRNTGAWTAAQEGWRFTPEALGIYNFTKCDDNGDGFETFDLSVAQGDLLPGATPAITFHNTAADALSMVNPLQLNYTNISQNQETIYANVGGNIQAIVLRAINCADDYDMDNVATVSEDLNNDSNLSNDDTDADGIANFIDNDDDGDLVLTEVEYVFTGRNANDTVLDTDADGIPNFLDNDDDGDGALTIEEDYNNNNNPLDDDTNNDGEADYLQDTVMLAVDSNVVNHGLSVYPNPATDILYIEHKSGENVSNIAVYTVNGVLVKNVASNRAMTTLSIADLQSGIYFVKVEMGNKIFNYKFIKK